MFINPYTGDIWTTEAPFRQQFYKALQTLSIRKRPAYNTRHTYATTLLMSNINPLFTANQLGHSPTILMTTYGKWIHGKQSKNKIGVHGFGK